MELRIILVRLGFLAFGLLNLIFGALLIWSPTFFKYWENKFWRQKGDAHRARDVLFYNKYVTGLVSIFIGVVSIYYAAFALRRAEPSSFTSTYEGSGTSTMAATTGEQISQSLLLRIRPFCY
jgi:hypothetical protein